MWKYLDGFAEAEGEGNGQTTFLFCLDRADREGFVNRLPGMKIGPRI